MAFLTAIVGVYDENGVRIDAATADGTRLPIVLKLGNGISGVAAQSGGFMQVTLTNTGSGRALGNGLEEVPLGTERVKMAGDGSILVDGSGVKVGVISDAQHGQRGGGNLHAVATFSADGFMPKEDRLDLADAGSSGASTLWRRDETSAAVQQLDGCTAPTVGIQAINTTAADGVTAQVSPAVVLSANAWATPGGSQRVDWAVVCEPENGVETPGATLRCYLEKNGGGWVEKCSISSAGVITCAGVTATGPVAGTTITASDHLEVGAAPRASMGTVRGPSTFLVGVKTADGLHDHGIFHNGINGADQIGIGDNTYTAGVTVAPIAGGFFSVAVGGAEKLKVDDNGVKIKGTYVDPYKMTGTTSADYTASFGDFVECDPTAAGFTVTLPDPTGNAGRGLTVFNASASTNAITISLTGKTINGAVSYSLAAAWTAVTLVSNGTNYYALPAAA